MRKTYCVYSSICLYLFVCIGLYVAPPVEKQEKEFMDKMHTIDQTKMSKKKAQKREFLRYFHSVLNVLSKDPQFTKKLQGVPHDEMGKAAVDYFKYIEEDVQSRLHTIKKKEVLYQQDLLAQKKTYMKDRKQTFWNPIHMENKDTFEMLDLKLLTDKFQMILDAKAEREREFKDYEMEKEHRRRKKEKKAKKSKDPEKIQKKDPEKKKHAKKQHERIHEPGHEEQLKEVWEKQDGLDPESFNEKTFFNLHDKNADGTLDQYELQTMFLNDVEKVYNESDPNYDEKEKDEELVRMTEHAMQLYDGNKDKSISYDEFMVASHKSEYKSDNEWKAVSDEEQFSPEEMKEYERERQQRIKDGDDDPDDEDREEEDEEDPENPEKEGKDKDEKDENPEIDENHDEKDENHEQEGKDKDEQEGKDKDEKERKDKDEKEGKEGKTK